MSNITSILTVLHCFNAVCHNEYYSETKQASIAYCQNALTVVQLMYEYNAKNFNCAKHVMLLYTYN